MIHTGLSRSIKEELIYVLNGRLLRKDIKKNGITDRETEIIRMTAQGMLPKSIIGTENYSVKIVRTHRRNAEAKLYLKLYELAQQTPGRLVLRNDSPGLHVLNSTWEEKQWKERL